MKPPVATALAPGRIIAVALLGLALPCLPLPAHPGSGLAVDAQGRVYFTAGPMIVAVETNGAARVIVYDRTNERFYQLHHLQPAPDGGLLTASDLGNALWRFTPDGTLSRFYPPENQDRALAVGTGGDPFAVDRAGNVYAVNSVQDRFTQILKVSPAGRISVLAGGDWGFADGPGVAARFGDLHGGSIVVASDGALLLTDDGARVRRVSAEGVVTTLAGGALRGFADGWGHEARLSGASGLALDPDGHVLVAEQSGRIRRITALGTTTTLAGTGTRGHQDGPALAATFDEPTGIAIGPQGDVYVLEPSGPRLRKISGGQVTTLHRGLPPSR